MAFKHYKRNIYVIASCTNERVNEEEIEFVDIHEDFEGRDRVTFKCPICEQKHTSLRFGR